jgi:transposase
MAKRPNPNLAKIHRNYTVEEVANLFSVHKNTVRLWVKDGLATTTYDAKLCITAQAVSKRTKKSSEVKFSPFT